MPYQVDLLPAAQRDLKRLPQQIQDRIIRALESLADEPRPPGTVAMKGTAGLLRIRVGDYRIVYAVRDQDREIMVEFVGHRREVYRRLE